MFKKCEKLASFPDPDHQEMFILFQLFLPLLVIVATCHAFPKPTEEEQKDGIVHDEAQETIYEDLRDHELQDSLNGGQSGLALELISHGENPSDLWSRLKRQEIMADHLEVPESSPIDEEVEATEAPAPIVNAAYAARLEASQAAIALANKLAGARRQTIERVPGYGRRKRQVKMTEDEIVLQEIFDPNVIDDSKFVNVVPQIKIKNWGEIGIQHPLA